MNKTSNTILNPLPAFGKRIERVVADGDYVLVHYQREDPTAEEANVIVYTIEDGKITRAVEPEVTEDVLDRFGLRSEIL